MLGAAEIRQLAEKLDIRPTKKLGQNFVIDPNTINRIVAAANLSSNDLVVEIGPGLGSLTLGILAQVDRVIAVEIDERLAAELPATIARHAPEKQLDLVVADALRVTSLPAEPTALVANLPYNISVPVLLHFLQSFPTITKGLVMVQAEVAHRLAASPNSKEYGVPSLKMAWYGPARLAGNIGRNIFWPVPGVDSALVFFERTALRDAELQQQTFTAIDQAFLQRRKTLRQALAGWAGSASNAEEILVRAGVDPQARGESLGIEQFISIASAK
ncbi:MAG: rRNA ((1518)-N(6)/adenine(1519)-N(6))-dimethyltransferase RsmA [Actinomycetota bacterium]|jgi:16S rRNA (adenine1518-N6/adenine1519-N6)-dimethyltransferase